MQAMPNFIVPLSDASAGLSLVGGKGASLARLAAAGLPVPPGFHITTAAYRRFVTENGLQERILAAVSAATPNQPATLEEASSRIGKLFAQSTMLDELADAIRQAYTGLGGGDTPVAVRSSATAEDLPDMSFAGQQETYLNIRGSDAVLDAVKKCWASLWTARVIAYRARQGIDSDSVALAVVVQELVYADAAGVMFTANPISGKQDEIMITAAWGLGEAIVSGAVTPDTLTVDKPTGRMIRRETAEKQVMTVRTEFGTSEAPVPDPQKKKEVLSDTQAAELAQLGADIEKLYGMPMDIEWTLAAGTFAIVQARPITALPACPTESGELQASIPSEWTRPDSKAICWRASITEQLPDPLTPLFATLGCKIISAGSARLFNGLLGMNTAPDSFFITINDYAYYQMRFSLRMVWGTIGGIASFWPQMKRSVQRWRDEAHVQYVAAIERWRSRPVSALTAAELLEGTRQLMAETVNTYTVLQSGVLGLASGAEVLFTAVYDKLIKRRDDPPAATFVLGFDSLPILAEKSLYDLAQQSRACPSLAEYILRTPAAPLAEQLAGDQTPAGLNSDDWRAWQRGFAAHLEKYGHAIFDLDFSKPLSADNPAPLLETCKMYLGGRGTNPHERQQMLASRREQAAQALFNRLKKGLRLKLCRKTLGWAQKFAPMREDSLADLGLGYPLLRQMLHELGRRLTQTGLLERPDDIYWLYEDEAIRAAASLDQGKPVSSLAEVIQQRKANWRARKSLTPPPTLPERSRMSRYMQQIGPAHTDQSAGNLLKGAGASQGRVTGQARVLHGPEDFSEMRPGEILVAAITTPAWTPLFAMASAIVTDVGGPLSHGSIVAREYGIPAVLGTGVATKRIQNGQTITVDGSAGTVTLKV